MLITWLKITVLIIIKTDFAIFFWTEKSHWQFKKKKKKGEREREREKEKKKEKILCQKYEEVWNQTQLTLKFSQILDLIS